MLTVEIIFFTSSYL